ncbi:MAG: hypothetical protein JST93_20630 [Acidobacteria bacterium]|nr:hypothetical protein [Acidobacteriota bacterium]
MNATLRGSTNSRLAMWLTVLIFVAAFPLAAQRYHITYTPNSQEGLMLQLIEQLDGAAKIQQMEEFLKRYPTHPSVAWIYAYMQDYFTRTNDVDRALAAGEKLFTLNPDDLETAVYNQKLAEKKGTPELVAKWTDLATKSAQKLIGAPKPFYITQEEWNKRLAYAGGLINQGDYALYKKAMEAEQVKDRIQLFQELIKTAPNSIYTVQAYPHLMAAYRTSGMNDSALSIAEKILAKDVDNEEALLTVAQVNLDRRTNYPRVITVANRLLSLGQESKKPENFSAEEWNKRRTFYAGAAYTLLGNANVFQNNFEAADRAFRAALPYIKGNAQAEASAYFYIGWSNYYLEKYKEAAAYFKMCMSMPSPFQQQAVRQLDGMKREKRIFED